MLDYGIDGNKYRAVFENPITTRDFATYHVYKQGKHVVSFGFGYDYQQTEEAKKLVDVGCLKHIKKDNNTPYYIKTLLNEQGYIIETIIDHELLKEAAERNKIQQKLERRWYQDIYEYYGLDPAAVETSLILTQAWEDGHDCGLYEVESHINKYVKFIEELDAARKNS
jgi:Ni,Fe-hydrogenase I large subunit